MGLVRSVVPAAGSMDALFSRCKDHARITTTAEDTLAADVLEAVVSQVERELDVALINQTWIWYRDAFPAGRHPLSDFWYEKFPSGDRMTARLEFPKHPVTAVTEIRYYDTANSLQALSSSVYEVSTKRTPAVLQPAYGEVWPHTYQRLEAVEIEFTAGFGATDAAFPANLRHGLMIAFSTAWEFREQLSAFNVFETPQVRSMLDGYRLRFTL